MLWRKEFGRSVRAAKKINSAFGKLIRARECTVSIQGDSSITFEVDRSNQTPLLLQVPSLRNPVESSGKINRSISRRCISGPLPATSMAVVRTLAPRQRTKLRTAKCGCGRRAAKCTLLEEIRFRKHQDSIGRKLNCVIVFSETDSFKQICQTRNLFFLPP